MRGPSLEGEFWRRFVRGAATRGPGWLVRALAPLIGVGICAITPDRRRRAIATQRVVHGPRSGPREALDAARSFATYASCLVEILGAGSGRGRLPSLVVEGEGHVRRALSAGRGVVLVTAHTAGWEVVGPVLTRDLGVRVMIAESPEADPATRAIQDGARRAHGLLVAHVGGDPLSALPLARHLREGGAVALQIDRVPPGMRGLPVELFGRPDQIPEGPLRLAAVTGAPVLPVFVSRLGHRRYRVVAHPGLAVERHATAADLGALAQQLADAMASAVRAHPTQWFDFEGRGRPGRGG